MIGGVDRSFARAAVRRVVAICRRGIVYWLPLAALLLAALARLAIPGFLERVTLLTFDAFERAAPRPPSELPVRIVAIDDKSLAAIGQWPWPRSVIAELIDRLREAGAGVVAIDILFTEPDRTSPQLLVPLLRRGGAGEDEARRLVAAMPDPDRRLAEALGRLPVVLGYSLGDEDSNGGLVAKAGFAVAGAAGGDPLRNVGLYRGALADLPELQKAAAGQGFINQRRNLDNVVRLMPLVARLGGKPVPSFAAETLRLATGAHSYVVRAAGAHAEKSFGADSGLTALKIGPLQVPTDGAGRVWLYYAQPDPNLYLSASDILAGKVDKAQIAGNIVLLGATAAGLNPLYATPLGTSMPGVEIHAQLIGQILQGTFLDRPDWVAGSEIVFTLIAGLILIVAVPRLGALAGAVCGGVMVAAIGAVSWFAFDDRQMLVDPAYPITVLTAVYLLSTALTHRQTERRQREIRQAFSRYMSPHYVAQLAKNPDKLVLGGELKVMTVMFCDIRGFTALSEGLDAHSLTEYVNSFLSPMTEIITAHGGTIDKFIGDCVMAFWNAPLDDPDHAKHAVAAAEAMRRRVAALNEEWAEAARQGGPPHLPLRVGIGINTGECCVGNFGSHQRFDYSLLGDPVNLASRLESLTKIYGVELIIGEDSAARLERDDLIELDLVAVKGKTRAVRIFTVPPPALDCAGFLARHRAMLNAYRGRDWNNALGALADDALVRDAEMTPVYALFRERVAALQKEAPPQDWDGVFVAHGGA
jgi:adenylate cyclase